MLPTVELLRSVVPEVVTFPGDWTRVRSWFENALWAIREAQSYLVIDTEYEKRDDVPIQDRTLRLIGFGSPVMGQGVQVWWDRLDEQQRSDVSSWLQALVTTLPIVFHNADADLRSLTQTGLKPSACIQIDDTMLAHAILHSEEEHTLDYLQQRYGKYPPYKDALGLAEETLDLRNWLDVLETGWVWEGLKKEFALDPAAEGVYREQSLKLLPIVIESNLTGLRTDQALPWKFKDKYDSQIGTALKIAQAYTGWPLNLGSPDQMQHYLYEVEKFPVQRIAESKDGAGNPTTNKDAITTLRQLVGIEFDGEEEEKGGVSVPYILERIERDAHPVLEARVLYAGAKQDLSHYIEPCFLFEGDKIIGVRDRVFPEIKIHAQASGRHSITGPPMQQMWDELYALFVPDPGTVWIGFDLDQAELRIDAVLTGDEPSLQAFENKWDIHTLSTCDIFGLPYPPDRCDPHTASMNAEWRTLVKWEGKDDIRRVFAKRFVYRLDYGGKPEYAGDIPGAKTLGLGPEKLVDSANRYLNAHPAKAEWRNRTAAHDWKYRVAYTFLGRPRRLTGQSYGSVVRAGANHRHQGAVSDINNLYIIDIKQALPYANYKFGSHDSQWWGVPVDRESEARDTIEARLNTVWDCSGRELYIPATFKEVRRAA